MTQATDLPCSSFRPFSTRPHAPALVPALIPLITTTRGRHGFVVAVTTVESVGTGIVRDDTGYVTFPVRYQCVVFRPFKGEILEGVVTTVNKLLKRRVS
ncbi:unnamed protein product [Closterium sp. NIES-53]